ncbi:phage protein [Methylobacterium sp. P31]
MTQQYLRACKATVNGVTVDGESFKIRFDTHQALAGTPHHINLYIYNLAPSTIAQMRKEKGKVEVYAGYIENPGLIFQGEAIQIRNGRESITNTYVHVLATSSENGRNYATVNKALAAGHTFKDRVDLATQSLAEYGVTVGFIDDLGSRKFPRNFVFSGMTHDLLRETCEAVGATWHIQGNRFYLLKRDTTLPGSVVVLNSDTGMVGLPEQTLDGVIVRCLLNPRIYPGTKLQINESSIQRAAFSPSTEKSAQANNELLKDGAILGLAADGVYKAWRVEHVGDTRGQPWYTEIVCTSGEYPINMPDLMLPDNVPGDGANR